MQSTPKTDEHGTVKSYKQLGCRCLKCRLAYSEDAKVSRDKVKAGTADFIVSAQLAADYLKELSAAGVGKRAVSVITDLPEWYVMKIRQGRQRRIRQSTERKILCIDLSARSGGATVPGRATTKRIAALLHEGFSHAELAQRLGYKCDYLKFYKRPRVTARIAMNVERMHAILMHDRTATVPVARRKAA